MLPNILKGEIPSIFILPQDYTLIDSEINGVETVFFQEEYCIFGVEG